jgi:hypothetical protein
VAAVFNVGEFVPLNLKTYTMTAPDLSTLGRLNNARHITFIASQTTQAVHDQGTFRFSTRGGLEFVPITAPALRACSAACRDALRAILEPQTIAQNKGAGPARLKHPAPTVSGQPPRHKDDLLIISSASNAITAGA